GEIKVREGARAEGMLLVRSGLGSVPPPLVLRGRAIPGRADPGFSLELNRLRLTSGQALAHVLTGEGERDVALGERFSIKGWRVHFAAYQPAGRPLTSLLVWKGD